MLSLGHRRIAAVLGPANVCKVTSYLAGIKHAMAAYGLELPDSHWQFGSYDVLDRQGLSTLMKTHPSVSALICMNDNLALAAIGALTEMGFSVPRDISVSGFGNASFSALMHPQLTTQDEKGAIIGTQAMELLMSMMDNKTTNPKVNLAFDLIVRETTAPPSRGD
jgi:LacI family repressor for deo operon, udp, cdd, tsx, nupC, and nupG